MNREKLRFFTVAAFASVLLFSVSAHAGPAVVSPPPANILDLQIQIDQEVIDRITADGIQRSLIDQLDEDVTVLQDQIDLLPVVYHQCTFTNVMIAAGGKEDDWCLCPDRTNHMAIGGGFDMGEMSFYPQVVSAHPVDPPCGSAFTLRLYNPQSDAITIPLLRINVTCVQREVPWPYCDEDFGE